MANTLGSLLMRVVTKRDSEITYNDAQNQQQTVAIAGMTLAPLDGGNAQPAGAFAGEVGAQSIMVGGLESADVSGIPVGATVRLTVELVP